MGTDIILNANNNIILAEGHSPRFWRSWRAIALGIIIGLCVLWLAFLILLSRPMPLPAGTIFYAIATTKEASTLSPEIRNALPKDWQAYFSSNSSWPYVFGLYRDGESIFGFVMSPLWRVPKTEKIHQTKRGLAMLAADTELPDRKDRSYWSYVFEHWRAGGPVIAVEPAEALGAVNGHEPRWIVFRMRDGLMQSDWNAPNAPSDALSDADISVRFPHESLTKLSSFESIPFLPAPDRLARLPSLSRADIHFGDAGVAAWTKLTFDEALSETQAGVLLGAYGFTIRRPIVLPDGTVSFERMEPIATSSTSLLGPRRDERGRSANILGNSFTLVSTSSSPEIANVANCSNAFPWVRFSQKTVAALSRRFGLELNSEQVRAVQVVADEGKLAVCFE